METIEDPLSHLKKLEKQNYELEKQLRAKDAVAKKDKAVYEQKIELLELKISEFKERYFKPSFIINQIEKKTPRSCMQP